MRALRLLLKVLAVLVLLVAVAAALVWWHIGRSRPLMEGEVEIAGLEADVTVDRDNLGVPSIRAQSSEDLARALGFVHAQERFFQMDLARRRAAGELAELFGRAALSTDRSARLHRFRARAAVVLAQESDHNRRVLSAYAAGVNVGLDALATAPFEYVLLRQTPRLWTPEDSILVIASMFFTLQDAGAAGEARMTALAEVVPPQLEAFLNTTTSDWDTPQLGDPLPTPAPPGPDVFDLRTAARVASIHAPPGSPAFDESETALDARGSNNWAVAGQRTSDGRAMVANDMHLSIGVPNIWYRASLSRPHNGRDLTITGVTLPGVPSVVAGSNGSLAWGFTNTTADWSDRVRLDTAGEGDAMRYMTPDGPSPFTVFKETIAISGEAPETFEVRETIWGPVDGPDSQGRLHAIVWVAHFAEALNFRLSALETATTIDEAIEIAAGSGTPGQNFVVADHQGHIGWTIAGRIPKREGFDGRLTTSWADGTRRWNGFYEPAEYPRIMNPASGVIVTANNRIVSGDFLTMLGDGGYDPGGRARQIRDGLLAVEKATIADMLRVQLDDRAIVMERWRGLALSVLKRAEPTPARTEFMRLIDSEWTGHASVDSAGYRLVRQFRLKAAELAWEPFAARARPIAPGFPSSPGRAIEGPVWTLLTTQPVHLLDPKYRDWPALMVEAVDQTIVSLTEGRRQLADRTWGEANTLTASHPISRAVPQLSGWLDLPRTPLPGDSHMPRFQSATNGASERFAVSPGDEQNGYFHMPGGQSGHPRSPHYRDGHNAWVKGEATPFLPGPSVARLVLRGTRAPISRVSRSEGPPGRPIPSTIRYTRVRSGSRRCEGRARCGRRDSHPGSR